MIHRSIIRITQAPSRLPLGLPCVLLAFLIAGCSGPPIGADLIGPHGSRDQVEKSAVTSGELSASTLSLLHRYDLDRSAVTEPGAALLALHARALATDERDLLFVLAELSYYTGEQARKLSPGTRSEDVRDYYLGSAIYAYLFLFGEAQGERPDGFERRFRTACEIYNYGLGMALTELRNDDATAHLQGGRRRVPVGSIELQIDTSDCPTFDQIEQFLIADQFRVRGLSVRNREAGMGAPLIAISPVDPVLQLRRSSPSTVFLRVNGNLADLASGKATGMLEVHSTHGAARVTVGTQVVPLELDLTTAHAYTLNQEYAWAVEKALFFKPTEALHSQILATEPYQPGKIPVVFVHGTYSSPVWWAEMRNTLEADPVVRARYQIWMFVYPSGQNIARSAREFREALTKKLATLDPEGRDPALSQMVIIGHSQGGLLTKLTAISTGDRFWQVLNEHAAQELPAGEEQRRTIQERVTFEPLPFVHRVIFISTPHRGSYLAGKVVRNLGRWFISIPEAAVEITSELVTPDAGAKAPRMPHGTMGTSLDGMSPTNPYLLAMADIPIAPGIKAHSIIPVKGDGDYHEGKDGVVAYTSAHLDGVESEYIVHGPHSCQSLPPTIEEVRRILLEHQAGLDAVGRPVAKSGE